MENTVESASLNFVIVLTVGEYASKVYQDEI
uniref:Uncharacterized protein n=1 Tax=Haemonchus contortus TaxID=6289 RepID=A0A7I5EBB4_HAECO